ncbi:SDR family NAD(P)-dependent oxidoreductase [Virgisporangium ochraceum]|uniref:Short-chain dehydrogenase/reductase SDR n=1 Tax=Virgisporangium ochraceum TaxID=65505 RepID=A0A8J3ZRV1_9ACTN|nr:SDR family NAD(P)-dependent oxidoreductase [Virgisporangium ochraceum]GIJ67863.1 hypothetical protein Voc01_027800 [Virgisporangium ochraceum]
MDLSGRTFLVTGASNGLGLATTRALVGRGAHVVMAVRDEARGRAAAADLPADRTEVRRLDLADLDSVRSFADRFRADHGHLDVLVNNAGVMAPPRTLSAQGHELQFAVNHLGHFALTGLLLDLLVAGRDPRVVTVRELHRRLTAAGSPVRSVLAHPGYARTNLQFQASTRMWRVLLGRIGHPTAARGRSCSRPPTRPSRAASSSDRAASRNCAATRDRSGCRRRRRTRSTAVYCGRCRRRRPARGSPPPTRGDRYQLAVQPDAALGPVPVPWKPNCVDCPALTRPL